MKSVSVCIPCFNQTEYLKRTLASVIEQDYPEMEIIVSDDSTNDEVKKLVSSLDSQIKIKYFRNFPSLGPAKNWNHCIKIASSDWIKILHHDDWLNGKDALYKFMQAGSKFNSFLFSSAVSFNVKDDIKFNHIPPVDFLEDLKTNPAVLFKHNLLGPPSSTLFNRNAAVLFDERMKWLVDVDFYIHMLKYSSGKFTFIDETLITSVNHANHNVTKDSNNPETELYEYFLLYNKLKELDLVDQSVLDRFIHLLSKYQIKSIFDLQPFLKDVFISETEFKKIIKSRSVLNFIKSIQSKLSK